jgi:hypothetical protein
VIPHEFDAWGSRNGFPDRRQRARTIALCTENPGTEWFEATYRLVPEFAAAVSINRSSAVELRRRGIRCEHVQLGYAPEWDTWQREESVERPLDVLYLGAADPRRDPLLAGFGRDLWARRCQFLVPPLEPRTHPRPDFLKGADKYHRLRSTKVLLNLHRTTSSALEWMRFLEAICNGCVVVSEPCADHEPLIPGEHFVSANIDAIPDVINRLLDDPERLRLLRQRSYDFVRKELPMRAAADVLAELAAELPTHAPTEGPERFSERVLTAAPPVVEETGALQEKPTLTDWPSLGARLSGRPIKPRDPGRLLRSLSGRLRRRAVDDLEILAQTRAYARAIPTVTVVSILPPSRAGEGVEALASIAASAYHEFEILILADDESDITRTRGFLNEQSSLPAMLLSQGMHASLGRSRNVLAERARGKYVFILDAEGGIYPSALERLARALDSEPLAIFAYPMVGIFDDAGPVELRSSLPWEPERLKRGNWIDAMALIRRERLLEIGGYSTDPRLAGWEEFELWCRCAEAGDHGVHVPEVLAWHRQAKDPVTAEMWTLMRARFPRLLGGIEGS